MIATSDPSGVRSSRVFVAGCVALVLIALILRLGWSLSRHSDRTALAALPDQLEYLQLADSLRTGQGLQFLDERYASQEPVRAFRMPGYPAFVALLGSNVVLVRAAQSFVDASAVLAAVLLARRIVGPTPALVAGAFVALDPLGVYFQSLLLTETLSAAMLVWAMYLLSHNSVRADGSRAEPMLAPDSSTSSRPSAGSAESAGASATLPAKMAPQIGWWLGILLLLFASYVRPSFLPFAFALGVASAIAFGRLRPASAHRFAVAFTLFVVTLASLLPWAFRNRAALGAWVWTTTNDGFTLYDGLNPDATGASDQRWSRTMPLLERMDEVERSRYLSSLAVEYAREHPRRVAELAIAKIGRVWSPVPLSAEYGRYALIAGAHAVPLFLLAAIALLPGGNVSLRVRLFLLMPAVIITVMHAASVGSIRYRYPVHAPLAVLAACTFAGRRSDAVQSEATPETDGDVDDRTEPA